MKSKTKIGTKRRRIKHTKQNKEFKIPKTKTNKPTFYVKMGIRIKRGTNIYYSLSRTEALLHSKLELKLDIPLQRQ